MAAIVKKSHFVRYKVSKVRNSHIVVSREKRHIIRYIVAIMRNKVVIMKIS